MTKPACSAPSRMTRACGVGAGFVLAVTAAACAGGSGVARGGGAVVRNVPEIDRFIVAASSPAEYRGIWGQAPTQRQLRQSLSALSAVEGAVVRVRPPVGMTAAESWLRAYRSSSASVVTLVGHNEAGVFRFADGSGVSLGELGGGTGPLVVVFSCDAAKSVTGRTVGTVPEVVTLLAATEMERRVVSLLDSGVLAEPQQLVGMVDAVTADVLAENSVFRLAGGVSLVSGGVIGVSVYVIRQ